MLRLYAWSGVAGFYFMFTLQAVHPLAKGVSVTQLALFVGLTAIATTLLEVPTGFVADRFSRKLSVGLAFVCEAAAFAGYALIASFWSLLPIAAFLALGRALKSGAEEALIYDDLRQTGRESDYLTVMSRASSLRNVSGVAAALAGPVLYVIAEPAPFLLSAIASLAAAAIVFGFDERRAPDARTEVRLMDGLRSVLRSRALRVVVLIELLMLVFVNLYYQVLFFPRLTSLGLDLELLGVVDVVMLGLTSPVLFALPRLLGRNATANLVALTGMAACVFVAFAFSQVLALALVFGVLFDLAWSARKPVLATYANQHFGSAGRALGLSSLSFAGNLGAALLLPLAAAALVWSGWLSVAPLVLLFGLLALLWRESLSA